MLGTQHRLQTEAVKFVLRRGRGLSGAFLRIKWAPARGHLSQATVVVPLAVDKRATKRNLVKRRVREALRAFLPLLSTATQVIVFAHKGAAERSFHELRDELVELLKKARLL